MARVQDQNDRNLSADSPASAGDSESSKHLLDQNEFIEVFDAAARLRFGKFISAAVLRSDRQ